MEPQLKVLTRQSSGQRPEQDDRPLLKHGIPDSPVPESGQTIEEMEKKYAAYVRSDVYGPMGRGKLSWVESFWLLPRLLILVPIRVVAGMSVLVSYYVICRVCTAFRSPNREDGEEQEDYAHLQGWRRALILCSGRFLSRVMLFVFGFYWISEASGLDEEGRLINENESSNDAEGLERYGAIISNHVSYIDILYHMSSSFPSFVAKRSVSKLPLVGLISKCLGCVFVQRELKSSNFKGVSGVVTERTRDAYQNEFAPKMMIFPDNPLNKAYSLFLFLSIFVLFAFILYKDIFREGTTTNGKYLLPFKTGVFLAKAPVLPVILRYPYKRFSPAWDSISGMRHVILLLSQFANYIEVRRLPVYHPSEQEKGDPKLYAANVRKLMAQEGNLIVSEIGLAEKRVYHAALNDLLSQR